MSELQRRLLNKEAITPLFTDEWISDKDRDSKPIVTNRMSLKIRGIKENIRILLTFREVVPNGLALSDWIIQYASVKIGDGRREAIKNEFIRLLNKEENYLPEWITENQYAGAVHLKTSYSSSDCVVMLLEKEVEPELLAEGFADMAIEHHSHPRTKYVFHNGKVYEEMLENNGFDASEGIESFIDKKFYMNQDIIIDTEGTSYRHYITPEDPNNIRIIKGSNYSGYFFSPYSSDVLYTLKEYVANKELEVDMTLPYTQRIEEKMVRDNYKNGTREPIPYNQVIEMIIYSPRILGEDLPTMRLGDYVKYKNGSGFVRDISQKDKGIYGIQIEHSWVCYAGAEANMERVHISELQKIEKPEQKDIGEIVFSYEFDSYHGARYKGLGEVVYEFSKYYVVKYPSFVKKVKLPESLKSTALENKYRGYNSYHANYVDAGDGYYYSTVKKDTCHFLKKAYADYYYQFCSQSQPLQWLIEHGVLGSYLYPILKTFDNSVLMPPAGESGHQLEQFLLSLEYWAGIKTPHEIYQSIVSMMEDKKWEAIRSIRLRGLYNIDDILEDYFTVEKQLVEEEMDELVALLS